MDADVGKFWVGHAEFSLVLEQGRGLQLPQGLKPASMVMLFVTAEAVT